MTPAKYEHLTCPFDECELVVDIEPASDPEQPLARPRYELFMKTKNLSALVQAVEVGTFLRVEVIA